MMFWILYSLLRSSSVSLISYAPYALVHRNINKTEHYGGKTEVISNRHSHTSEPFVKKDALN